MLHVDKVLIAIARLASFFTIAICIVVTATIVCSRLLYQLLRSCLFHILSCLLLIVLLGLLLELVVTRRLFDTRKDLLLVNVVFALV